VRVAVVDPVSGVTVFTHEILQETAKCLAGGSHDSEALHEIPLYCPEGLDESVKTVKRQGETRHARLSERDGKPSLQTRFRYCSLTLYGLGSACLRSACWIAACLRLTPPRFDFGFLLPLSAMACATACAWNAAAYLAACWVSAA
jgi:hypothetical protein